jgi:hypothetical protein
MSLNSMMLSVLEQSRNANFIVSASAARGLLIPVNYGRDQYVSGGLRPWRIALSDHEDI